MYIGLRYPCFRLRCMRARLTQKKQRFFNRYWLHGRSAKRSTRFSATNVLYHAEERPVLAQHVNYRNPLFSFLKRTGIRTGKRLVTILSANVEFISNSIAAEQRLLLKKYLSDIYVSRSHFNQCKYMLRLND